VHNFGGHGAKDDDSQSGAQFNFDAGREVPVAKENQTRTLPVQLWRLILKN